MRLGGKSPNIPNRSRTYDLKVSSRGATGAYFNKAEGDMTALVDVSLRLKSEDFIISREIIIR